MISLCNADGSLSPLRFRYEDEEQQIRKAHVTQILSRRQLKYVDVEFFLYSCRAIEEDREWTYELQYVVRSHRWLLLSRNAC